MSKKSRNSKKSGKLEKLAFAKASGGFGRTTLRMTIGKLNYLHLREAAESHLQP